MIGKHDEICDFVGVRLIGTGKLDEYISDITACFENLMIGGSKYHAKLSGIRKTMWVTAA